MREVLGHADTMMPHQRCQWWLGPPPSWRVLTRTYGVGRQIEILYFAWRTADMNTRLTKLCASKANTRSLAVGGSSRYASSLASHQVMGRTPHLVSLPAEPRRGVRKAAAEGVPLLSVRAHRRE